MRRVVILGRGGAGKSTLARRLGDAPENGYFGNRMIQLHRLLIEV